MYEGGGGGRGGFSPRAGLTFSANTSALQHSDWSGVIYIMAERGCVHRIATKIGNPLGKTHPA